MSSSNCALTKTMFKIQEKNIELQLYDETIKLLQVNCRLYSPKSISKFYNATISTTSYMNYMTI